MVEVLFPPVTRCARNKNKSEMNRCLSIWLSRPTSHQPSPGVVRRNLTATDLAAIQQELQASSGPLLASAALTSSAVSPAAIPTTNLDPVSTIPQATGKRKAPSRFGALDQAIDDLYGPDGLSIDMG